MKCQLCANSNAKKKGGIAWLGVRQNLSICI
nr:MAG TPA: hypothetical protein [Caudoviricetes sp.]